ncbi:MAG: biopolymer transport protein ExbB [Arenicella sp.]|jgi:biopolymer transport protein ExbB
MTTVFKKNVGIESVMQKLTKAAVLSLSAITILLGGINVQAQSLDIEKVYNTTTRAASKERSVNAARENSFKAERSKQQGRLNSMTNERTRQERIGKELERKFEENDVKINVLTDELAKELGDLKQLFGVIQLSASEAQEAYKSSYISAQYPDRSENLRQMVEKMSSLTELVSIDEIEDLWFQLQNEMTEQGKIVTYTAAVRFKVGEETDDEGKIYPIYEPQDRQVTRVGVFSAVSGGDILTYNDTTGFTALNRQMGGSRSAFTKLSENLQSLSSGVTPFMLDPSKGVLSSAYVQEPTIAEKAQEGGVVGYVIIGLGLIGLLIAVVRILILMGVEAKVKKQARDLKRPSLSNPLGRVIKVFQDNPTTDPESMELKLGEAMLKESPKLNAWVMFVKIIAVVAPLLGLLGTVTGMIQTFQAITLYGAGDPQTMAGGISQALVTTVLGLVVAIPMVFLHWLASSRAKRIEGALEEHAAGLIAEQYEINAK